VNEFGIGVCSSQTDSKTKTRRTKKIININRPFRFFVIDTSTNTILFEGLINHPKMSQTKEDATSTFAQKKKKSKPAESTIVTEKGNTDLKQAGKIYS